MSSHSSPAQNVHIMWETNDVFFINITSTINKALNCAGQERKMLPANPGCITAVISYWACGEPSGCCLSPQTPRANSKMQRNGGEKNSQTLGVQVMETEEHRSVLL